jgi:hypothetical protein
MTTSSTRTRTHRICTTIIGIEPVSRYSKDLALRRIWMNRAAHACMLAVAASFAAVASNEAQAATPPTIVAEYAGFAADAYSFTRDPHWKPKAGCTVVEQVKRTDTSGFQAIAFLCSGKLVVSFTGTKFTEKDEMDMAADKALLKISELRILELAELRKAEKELAADGWKARKGSSRFTYECLAAKIHEAEKFFADALAKSKVQKSAVTVVGHSLGGFLAEYIGAVEGVATHAFNAAPGAKLIAPSSAKGGSVTSHHRKWDLVSGAWHTHATHIGTMCEYAGLEEKSKEKAATDQRDTHSIEVFAHDLADGLKPKKCD